MSTVLLRQSAIMAEETKEMCLPRGSATARTGHVNKGLRHEQARSTLASPDPLRNTLDPPPGFSMGRLGGGNTDRLSAISCIHKGQWRSDALRSN